MNGRTLDESAVLGLIPARGGSKSIPMKNLLPLAGRPLISYVIGAGHAAASVSRLVCSTDSDQIAAVCRSSHVEVLPRPTALSQDETPVADVVRHVLEALYEGAPALPAFVVLLQPTSPFVQPEHIDACVARLREQPDADSAQTVAAVPHNLHAVNQRIIDNGRVQFRFLEERRAAYNKQRKAKHFTFGNVVVTRAAALIAGKDCFGDVSIPVEIRRLHALDVDTAEDADYATFLVETGRIRGLP